MSTPAVQVTEEPGQQTKEVTYLEAISQALWEELERDEHVLLMGEDIGTYGGAFKVTEGFLDHFGSERVIDMVLAESQIIGAATGAALMGLRPVVEMQYADFIACGFDQLVNVAAKYHYRSGSAVPLVIRGPSGGGVRGGPFHSGSPEAYFVHTPGLKVVAPSTPTDAKGLLKAAIRDDNPVVYFEHKFLYRRLKETLPAGDHVVPLGKADIKREGTDVTIISYGAMVSRSLEAAEALAERGVSAEVLDLRTLHPLDKQAILESVAKTSRAMIVHEDVRVLGIGAEVSAILAEEGFESLDAPVVRITAPHTPVPFSPPLEDAFLPQTAEVVAAAEQLAAF